MVWEPIPDVLHETRLLRAYVEHSGDAEWVAMKPRPASPDATGVFSPFPRGALAGVRGNTIGQWSRCGLIKPTLYRGRPANLYEFRDVAEAIVVHGLFDRPAEADKLRELATQDDEPVSAVLRRAIRRYVEQVEGGGK
jgi:hypothetical protein